MKHINYEQNKKKIKAYTTANNPNWHNNKILQPSLFPPLLVAFQQSPSSTTAYHDPYHYCHPSHVLFAAIMSRGHPSSSATFIPIRRSFLEATLIHSYIFIFHLNFVSFFFLSLIFFYHMDHSSNLSALFFVCLFSLGGSGN